MTSSSSDISNIHLPSRLKNSRTSLLRDVVLSKELVSINLLKSITEIINFATVTTLYQNDTSLCRCHYPFLLNWTDNQTSKAWIKKSVSKIVKGKVFQRIIMINNLVGLKADFIKGTKIILADRISRLYSNSSTPPFFHSLTHEIP